MSKLAMKPQAAKPSDRVAIRRLSRYGLTIKNSSLRPVAKHPASSEPNIHILRAILELPEDDIDLARAKLTIDHMIDPCIDINGWLMRLDDMVSLIRQWWQLENTTSLHKLNALRTYLYQAGVWNSNQPCRYNFDDPEGRIIRHKLLPCYLETRKGNCVSMPLLLLILGRKLGLDMSAAESFEHIFVKYRDEAGNRLNLEATDMANAMQDASFNKNFSMTPQALSNGIYMRSLSNRETVIVMMSTLMEFYKQPGQDERCMAVAGLALEYRPNDVSAMVHIGAAFYRELKRVFLDRYASIGEIPPAYRPHYEYLRQNNMAWFAKAESLGWREPDKKARARYIDRLKLLNAEN
jgi:regulator of sirC expression with transglutaminase-like and TPR domain